MTTRNATKPRRGKETALERQERREAKRLRQEIREDARRFILEGAEAGVPPFQLLDELASFYDGDICDLF